MHTAYMCTHTDISLTNVQGSFAMLIEIHDHDSFTGHDYVDTIRFGRDNLSPSADSSWTAPITYAGERGAITTPTEITMRFRVVCDENWYGSDCNTECIPEAGRFTCDSNGGIVCVDGWTGPFCATRMSHACIR